MPLPSLRTRNNQKSMANADAKPNTPFTVKENSRVYLRPCNVNINSVIYIIGFI